MTREQIQHEVDRPLPCAAQEAFRCRPGALSDDEKTILSAVVLQKGEAEAGEIFRESPEHLRDYTILKGVNSYAALGRYYLANETTVPEELYEYMDLMRWAAAMRTSIQACSSAVIMCATLRRNRILPWKCSS